MSTTKKTTAIVIGAGVGGLGAAAHLAQRGFRVTVLEKNIRPGGRCDRFEREGHFFDAGPTLVVMPRLYESEFNHLGLSAHEALALQRVDPTYHLYFEGGSRLALTSDLKRLGEQIEVFERGSSAGLRAYLRRAVDTTTWHSSDWCCTISGDPPISSTYATCRCCSK